MRAAFVALLGALLLTVVTPLATADDGICLIGPAITCVGIFHGPTSWNTCQSMLLGWSVWVPFLGEGMNACIGS